MKFCLIYNFFDCSGGGDVYWECILNGESNG